MRHGTAARSADLLVSAGMEILSLLLLSLINRVALVVQPLLT